MRESFQSSNLPRNFFIPFKFRSMSENPSVVPNTSSEVTPAAVPASTANDQPMEIPADQKAAKKKKRRKTDPKKVAQENVLYF